jgi:hypothetical protein
VRGRFDARCASRARSASWAGWKQLKKACTVGVREEEEEEEEVICSMPRTSLAQRSDAMIGQVSRDPRLGGVPIVVQVVVVKVIAVGSGETGEPGSGQHCSPSNATSYCWTEPGSSPLITAIA